MFSFTRADGVIGLSLRQDADPLEVGGIQIPTLELGGAATTGPDQAAPPTAEGDRLSLDATKTRRLTLRRALLSSRPAQLQAALERLPLSERGFNNLRLWFEADGPWLAGRVKVDEQEAAFTIRVALEAQADAPRRLLVFLGDVRLYAPLTIPAPLVGALLATAVVGAWPEAGTALRASGASLDLAPLDLVLPNALVASGWRLPNLKAVLLDSIEKRAGELRLAFTAERDATARDIVPLGPSAWIEGQRVPEPLAMADEKLYAGDRPGAEADYRRLLAEDESNGARAARVRLAALRLAASAPDTGPRGIDMTRRWPEFVPGWLTAALAAVQNDEPASAAELFAKVADLTTARGEAEDAHLARLAGEAARAAEVARAAAAAQCTTPGDDAPAAGAPFAAAPITDFTQGQEPAPQPHASAVPKPIVRTDPGNITSQTRAVYAAESDPETRDTALGNLLKGFDSLPVENQSAAYASFARVAESTGDLAHAEEAYWRGTNLDGRPEQTVDMLLAHARLLLSRGSDRAAVVDLEEALKLAPNNPHTVAARAELAFRDRDFPRARDLYDKLAELANAAEAVARETVLHRRAVLARAAGDEDDAEACFRELTALDPRQIEAREALADIAFQRGDLETAAQYLDEALHLLPPDALDAQLELRTKLGDIHIGLCDWDAARLDFEATLDQDPGNLATLEHLADVYERLDRFDEAASTCDQLSRLYHQSRKRAQALYRRGEILEERLGDEARAFDAFLKSSDLDPTFLPTALRLVEGFFRRGSFDDVTDLADELEKSQDLATLPLPIRLRLAISFALVQGGAAYGLAIVDRDDLAGDVTDAIAALKEAAPHLSTRSPDQLEPIVSFYDALGAEAAARSALAAASPS